MSFCTRTEQSTTEGSVVERKLSRGSARELVRYSTTVDGEARPGNASLRLASLSLAWRNGKHLAIDPISNLSSGHRRVWASKCFEEKKQLSTKGKLNLVRCASCKISRLMLLGFDGLIEGQQLSRQTSHKYDRQGFSCAR